MKKIKKERKVSVNICSVCRCDYLGFGNNAQPINAGRCCDRCNNIVIVARINDMRRRSK